MRKIPALLHSFFLLTILVLLFSLAFFHPGIRPRWDSHYRRQLLDKFISQVEADQKIDPQKYWYFRERYSPGNLSFNSQAIDMLQTFKITNLEELKPTVLLNYQSKHLSSTDSVTPEPHLIKKPTPGSDEKYIINQDNLILQKIDEHHLKLEFVLPISEMKKANGLFDYKDSENQLLENKFWLNQTLIEF